MSSDGDVAVRVQGLTKSYRLNTNTATSLAEVIKGRLLNRRPNVKILQALDDVDLTIVRGEAVGIIGHNGAGKSTFLKILSRVTEPTSGTVRIRGKVGALLEVGTGFHPELTGRENVYLNGSILGMSRFEIRRQFDDIVQFAGVERFLDVPVKRYSSGMSVRLAFSVAASLRSDVLIVDEVLAVGDAEFQRKCLGRMAEVASEGRTVLFVSHNLVAVQALCSRAVLLKSGRVELDSSPAAIVHQYLRGLTLSGTTTEPGTTHLELDAKGDERPHLRRVQVSRGGSEKSGTVTTGGSAVFTVDVGRMDELASPHIGLSFWTETETIVATVSTQMNPVRVGHRLGGDRTYSVLFPRLPLLPGSYWVDIGVRDSGAPEYVDLAVRAFSLTVVGTDVYGSGVLPVTGEGLVFVEHEWSVV